jgi:hypothetical protein
MKRPMHRVRNAECEFEHRLRRAIWVVYGSADQFTRDAVRVAPRVLGFRARQNQGRKTAGDESAKRFQVINTEDPTIGAAFGQTQPDSLPFEGRDPAGILVDAFGRPAWRGE